MGVIVILVIMGMLAAPFALDIYGTCQDRKKETKMYREEAYSLAKKRREKVRKEMEEMEKERKINEILFKAIHNIPLEEEPIEDESDEKVFSKVEQVIKKFEL